MRIAFASADWGHSPDGLTPHPGGAGWVRIHQPAAQLAAHGHETVVGSGIAGGPNDKLVPLNHQGQPLMLDADIVVVQRWMHTESTQAIRAARRAGQIVIHDVDDWFWGLDPKNQAHRNTSRAHAPDNNREHYRQSVAACDAVTVSTGFLAKRIKERMGVGTYLIRNAVDGPTFATQPVRNITKGLVVGWCGALAWRSGDLETLADALPSFLAQNASVFVHHGTFAGDTDTAADRIGLPPQLVGPSRPAVAPLDYPDNVAGFDIGIVPLADVQFNHAKSWIKGLEYAAAGIPFVAADTPEYRALGAGLLAKTPAQWREALDQLTDPQERRREAERGLEIARVHDVRRRWLDWELVYSQLLHARS